jgi:hypothetical protein
MGSPRDCWMQRHLQYLLLQTRNLDDAMRRQEVECFARVLDCDPTDVAVVDFLSRVPTKLEVDAADVVLLGGSGHYSAAAEGEWLVRSFDTLRELYHRAKPTFASCWGFQAMARALGGRCIHDLRHAELGTIELTLTDAGVSDPLRVARFVRSRDEPGVSIFRQADLLHAVSSGARSHRDAGTDSRISKIRAANCRPVVRRLRRMLPRNAGGNRAFAEVCAACVWRLKNRRMAAAVTRRRRRRSPCQATASCGTGSSDACRDYWLRGSYCRGPARSTRVCIRFEIDRWHH